MTRATATTPRRGAVLAATLVCLLVVTSLVTTMLTGTLKLRRQLLVERDARQAELLVAAGLDRAAHRLSVDGAYRGERWEPSLTADTPSVVEITASPPVEGRTQIDVAVEYTANRPTPVRRSQTFFIRSEPTNPEE